MFAQPFQLALILDFGLAQLPRRERDSRIHQDHFQEFYRRLAGLLVLFNHAIHPTTRPFHAASQLSL